MHESFKDFLNGTFFGTHLLFSIYRPVFIFFRLSWTNTANIIWNIFLQSWELEIRFILNTEYPVDSHSASGNVYRKQVCTPNSIQMQSFESKGRRSSYARVQMQTGNEINPILATTQRSLLFAILSERTLEDEVYRAYQKGWSKFYQFNPSSRRKSKFVQTGGPKRSPLKL